MFSGVLSTVLTSLISALAGWLVRHFQEIIKDAAAKKVADDAILAAVKALDEAKTKEQLDEAARKIASNL